MNEEQKAAASVRMKAIWADKKAAKEATEKSLHEDMGTVAAPPAPPPPKQEPVRQPIIQPQQTIAGEADINALRQQIQEMKDAQWQFMMQMAQQNPNVTNNQNVQNGKLTGTFVKYALDKDNYPDPTERLAQEPRLARFAFPLNYELKFTVSVSEYTTIDNIRTREPKFQLELIKIVVDEDTGIATNGRYVICQLIMHEDPEAAMIIARENGLEVDHTNETAFLNEMRYIRMRDWLIESFYPRPADKETTKKDMVISGVLVQYYEKSNEEGKSVTKQDWDKISKVRI